jgi:hypothetical protein
MLIILVALSRHIVGHPAKKQSSNLHITLEPGIGVENEMFHFRSLCEGNGFPTFAEFLGIVHRVVLPLR